MNTDHVSRACLGCGTSGLRHLFSLGALPPVNNFLTQDEVPGEVAYPLDVAVCPACSLVQLEEVVPPEILFRHYKHLSSASQSNVAHLTEVVERLASFRPLARGHKVLEIGSNDGTLLKQLSALGAEVLGVDPARNVAELANEQGVRTIAEFFSSDVARRLVTAEGPFDFIVALNVVPHSPAFMDILSGMELALAPGGVVIIEGVHVYETLFKGHFDTVYHEHVLYFSLFSMDSALGRAGLAGVHAEAIPTQGGSLRVFAQRRGDAAEVSKNYTDLLEEEKRRNVMDPESYLVIGERVAEVRQQIRRSVAHLKAEHGKLVGLGAPARGVVLINACGLTTDELKYVIDDTPLKQGRLVPGAHIPVASWERLHDDSATAFLLLSWNYRDEIVSKLGRYISRGRVLVPLPQVTLEHFSRDRP